jgi:hypothetical protein
MKMSTMNEKMMRDAGLHYPLCYMLLLNLSDDAFELLFDHEVMIHLNYYFYVLDHLFKKYIHLYVFCVFDQLHM